VALIKVITEIRGSLEGQTTQLPARLVLHITLEARVEGQSLDWQQPSDAESAELLALAKSLERNEPKYGTVVERLKVLKAYATAELDTMVQEIERLRRSGWATGWKNTNL
jgi:hypothetical protein